ncbi:MAG: M20/M25/M40 family metallo-hydrolase [bacterium]|nr:M20/M25/M40 family metallo-hydrolase [bacterium]
MNTRLCKAILLTVLLLMTASVSAQDLGLVSINSLEDAELAENLFGTAYARVDNRFLVAADDQARSDLEVSGLAFETLFYDVSPSEMYLVLAPHHPDLLGSVDFDQLGRSVDLDGGTKLMAISRAAAASLVSQRQRMTVPLEDRSIRFYYMPPAMLAAPNLDFPTDSLVGRISQDSIYAYDQRLEDFSTRYVHTDSLVAARNWLRQKFIDFGYTDVTTPSFWWEYENLQNVKAVKLGYAEPDKVIVIGGHYDAVTYNQPTEAWEFAPGADDNGSGTALVLEIARVLADVPLRKTVIFMPFSAEEVGLVGSSAAASNFASAGTNLEVMYNYDMIGYVTDGYWDFDLWAGHSGIYLPHVMAAAERVSSLVPLDGGDGGSSDHKPFLQQGFHAVNGIEGDFNFPGWHTDIDLTIHLNFDYMTDVVRMALAALVEIADGTYPITIENVVDPGDGQSLAFDLGGCASDVEYTLYWGTTSGTYTDSSTIPAGNCSWVLDGLVEGQTYYLLAIGQAPTGYRGIYGVEGSGESWLRPRAPVGLAGTAKFMRLDLQWDANTEVDFSHYNIYRRVDPIGSFVLLETGYHASTYADTDVAAHAGYTYRITAVDNDGYESDVSDQVSLVPASFDGGIALVDETITRYEVPPTQADQSAFYDTIFGDHQYQLVLADEEGDVVANSDIGQFSSVFWIDDDPSPKSIVYSENVLDWFGDYNTDIFVAGRKTLLSWYTNTQNSLPRDEFLVHGIDYWGLADFVGAHGQGGWPAVVLDTNKGMVSLPEVAWLAAGPGAQVIYTYDSYLDHTNTEGKPVGLAYDGPSGKRVILSFPIWNLSTESAANLIAKVIEYFGDAGQTFDRGDIDHSGTIDIRDLSLLISYLFLDLQPLDFPDEADMDGSPGVNIGDLDFMVRFMFLGGPSPVPPVGP